MLSTKSTCTAIRAASEAPHQVAPGMLWVPSNSQVCGYDHTVTPSSPIDHQDYEVISDPVRTKSDPVCTTFHSYTIQNVNIMLSLYKMLSTSSSIVPALENWLANWLLKLGDGTQPEPQGQRKQDLPSYESFSSFDVEDYLWRDEELIERGRANPQTMTVAPKLTTTKATQEPWFRYATFGGGGLSFVSDELGDDASFGGGKMWTGYVWEDPSHRYFGYDGGDNGSAIEGM